MVLSEYCEILIKNFISYADGDLEAIGEGAKLIDHFLIVDENDKQ